MGKLKPRTSLMPRKRSEEFSTSPSGKIMARSRWGVFRFLSASWANCSPARRAPLVLMSLAEAMLNLILSELMSMMPTPYLVMRLEEISAAPEQPMSLTLPSV